MNPDSNAWAVPPLDDLPVGRLGRGLDTKASRACLLAETLAWAVTRGIPLPDALRSLPFYRNRRPEILELQAALAWMLTPTFYWLYIPWLNDLRWTARINHVIEDLENGLELGPTLHWWLGRFVPAFYLQGVMRAETDNRLATALPILAEQMAYPLAVTRRRFMATLSAIVELFVLAWVVLFLMVFIVPRLQEICEDMGVPLWFPNIPAGPLGSLGLVLTGLSLWVIGLLLLPQLGQWGHRLSHRIPWVTPNRRRFLLLDLSRTLCAYLRQGDDLLTAATWAQKTTPSYWLKRRLERFLHGLRDGEPWLDAWEKARLTRPHERWALRNADSREDPASGFALIAQWTHQQIETTTGRLERWLAPIATILLGACAGAVGASFFYAMSRVLRSIL